MAGYFKRVETPRTTQPEVGVGVNPKWVERGLVALFDCRQGMELISGDRATSNTATYVTGANGVAADFSGTANQQYAHRASYVVTGAITIAPLIDVSALTNYGAIISKMGSTTANVPFELRVGNAATDGKIYFGRATGSGITQYSSSTNLLSAPFSGMIIVSSSSGLVQNQPYTHVNGVKSTPNITGGTTGNCTDNGSSVVWIARRFDGVTQLDGRLYYVPLFNVELSDAHKKELYENPWDIYAPQQRNIYVGVSSSGTTIAPGAGTVVVLGLAPTIEQPQALTPDLGAVVLTGFVPVISQPQTIAPGLGAVVATGFAPAIVQGSSLMPGLASIVVQGLAPSITQSTGIAPALGEIVCAGLPPTIAQPRTIAPSIGVVELTGFAPSISQAATINPATGAIVVQGLAPTLSQPQTLAPGLGAATVQGLAPTISQSISLMPGTGQIIFTGLDPSILQPRTISPGLGAAVYQGYAPSLGVSDWPGDTIRLSSPISMSVHMQSPISQTIHLNSAI